MWLYNDKQFPKLPEVPGHEFAFITPPTYHATYALISELYLCSSKPYQKNYLYWENGCSYQKYIIPALAGGGMNPAYSEWIFQKDGTVEPGGFLAEVPTWANEPIYRKDGTLYLAASDPVPVPQLNPAALMQGYMVGQAVRRNRT